uniref:Uncharacterized protein n=1 Tax=Coccidioides posadasii RMSCC 3488 TaxID=454284 RepID=A0A0J6FNB9_COCPO|nr:hypothetical protein CPAG_06731 [Coccidioides posadasii RMSCC 3488]
MFKATLDMETKLFVKVHVHILSRQPDSHVVASTSCQTLTGSTDSPAMVWREEWVDRVELETDDQEDDDLLCVAKKRSFGGDGA